LSTSFETELEVITVAQNLASDEDDIYLDTKANQLAKGVFRKLRSSIIIEIIKNRVRVDSFRF
jgi:hypothetical protein